MGHDILVVEDDPSVGRAIERSLVAVGHRPRLVASVAEAEEALRTDSADILILDIDLPDGSGWDILRDLRSQGRMVPVVVISALAPNRRLLSEFECTLFLEKPFPMDALLRLVGQASPGSADVDNSGHSKSGG
jgi:two-component system catabolic regulation response regulator CreB